MSGAVPVAVKVADADKVWKSMLQLLLCWIGPAVALLYRTSSCLAAHDACLAAPRSHNIPDCWFEQAFPSVC